LHRARDPDRVELVALAGAATITGWHPGRLDNVVSGSLQPFGHDRAERSGALNDNQGCLVPDPST
jgi:hypothetical protein